MTYGDPSALLADALAIFPQHRERFEADFEHFCAYSGLLLNLRPETNDADHLACEWARWAFWSAGDYNGREE